VAPVGEQDFTTYLRALEGLDPQMIVATGHPPGAGAITVQSADLGFDVPITGAYTPRSLIMKGAKDAAIGRYADFGCADVQSNEYQDLARRFLQASSNSQFFEDDALASYGIVKVVAEAAGKVGDDPAAIAEHLHGNTFDIPGYSFELRWTEWGELANAQIAFDLIDRGPAPEGVNEAGTWYPKRLLVSEPLEPFRPQ
jgi:branched-chain amino acid transport system substrate-binding protein